MASLNLGSNGCKERCQRFVSRASSRSTTIEFLLDNLTANGCTVGSGALAEFASCADCPDPGESGTGMSGGFAINVPKSDIQAALKDKTKENFGGSRVAQNTQKKDARPTIVVCQNHVQDFKDFEQIIAHELIHAIDQVRPRGGRLQREREREKENEKEEEEEEEKNREWSARS